MTDDSVIEEAAKAMYFEDCGVAALGDDAEPFREMARAAFAVFEKAHTPTDDEREAEARKYATDRYREVIYLSEYNAAVSAFVEGAMWRSSEPQDEPTAAHVLEDFLGKLAGSGAYVLDFTSAVSLHGHIVRILKRDIAALRAAGEVK